MVKKNNRGTLIHVISWILIFILPYLNFISKPEEILTTNKVFLLLPFSFILFLCGIFYANLYWIAPKYLNKRLGLLYTVIMLLGFGLFILYNYVIFKYIIFPSVPLEDRPTEDESQQWRTVFRFTFPFLFYVLTLLISNILHLLSERRKEKEISRKVEFEKVEAELNMLKLQISPHFLFNTLNNIRWLVRKKSEDSEESILKLSEILRYIIYDVNTDKVTVRQESDHLRNYLKLQSLRIQSDASIEFEVESRTEQYMIAPLLFIHFVENAFKYGVDGRNTPEISISITSVDNGLVFKCRNKILNPGNTLENQGVGISNVKRRLELLYPQSHELIINEKNNYFDVELKIELHEN